jgi:hypothetical protein
MVKPVPIRVFVSSLSLLLLGLGHWSCKSVNSRSEGKHLEGEIVVKGPHYIWPTVDEKTLSDLVFGDVGETLADDTPIVRRMQAYSDHLYAIARSINPDQMAFIPRPKVKIFRGTEGDPKTLPISIYIPQPLKSFDFKAEESGEKRDVDSIDLRSTEFQRDLARSDYPRAYVSLTHANALGWNPSTFLNELYP